jgi:hypothetical protein
MRASCYGDVLPQPSLAEDHVESLVEILGAHTPARSLPASRRRPQNGNPSVERPGVGCLHERVSLLFRFLSGSSRRHNSLVRAADVILGTQRSDDGLIPSPEPPITQR